MLTQVHILLTYACTFECDHCFLYCSPRAKGIFTLAQIREVLAQTRGLGTVEWIYFEGGEAFLYYPVLLEGLRLARELGFQTGLVTNCYWATADEDAKVWLEPFAKSGINDLSNWRHGKSTAKIRTDQRRRPRQGEDTRQVTLPGTSASPTSTFLAIEALRFLGEYLMGLVSVFHQRIAVLLQRQPATPSTYESRTAGR